MKYVWNYKEYFAVDLDKVKFMYVFIIGIRKNKEAHNPNLI
jgi:hypothetical protein